MPVAADRRQFLRLPLDLPVTLLVAGESMTVRGRIRDISQGGCFLTTGVGPGMGLGRDGRVSMDFVVLPRLICNATGRVVRSEDGQGVGVEFGAVNGDLQRFVTELETASPEKRAEALARVVDPEIHLA